MVLRPEDVEAIDTGARQWLLKHVDDLLTKNAEKGVIGAEMDFYKLLLPEEHRPTDLRGNVSPYVPDETIAWMCRQYQEAGWEVTNTHDRAGYNESYQSTHIVTIKKPRSNTGPRYGH